MISYLFSFAISQTFNRFPVILIGNVLRLYLIGLGNTCEVSKELPPVPPQQVRYTSVVIFLHNSSKLDNLTYFFRCKIHEIQEGCSDHRARQLPVQSSLRVRGKDSVVLRHPSRQGM